MTCVTLSFVVSAISWVTLWMGWVASLALNCLVLHWVIPERMNCVELCKILFEAIRSACCDTHWTEWKSGNSNCQFANLEWHILSTKELQELEQPTSDGQAMFWSWMWKVMIQSESCWMQDARMKGKGKQKTVIRGGFNNPSHGNFPLTCHGNFPLTFFR